ncbi:hypothetical protein CK203_114955 [Vitis vinifera]|uniref:Uncharacterized protein n=1 Tax=Vitis vinifera TaxID=29760 RepID=A0A438C9W6_VITVI|nr:hypothetical protein CK203_114955 [Vitis vinifera]
MNFMSYMAEVSRGWDEPNARDMGRMTSQPNAKGEMYILNDGIDMKAKIAAMGRRLEKLEMTNMQPVQAISQTPLQAMLCAICLSYEHLVEECSAISAKREMFRDQANVVGQFKPNNNAPYGNTYNSSWRNHPNFSWKARATQYQQPDQPSQQSSSLEQAIANLSKVVGDFVGNQEAINAQINQRIDRVESTLNKRMDEMQNDISQKFDNLQYSISRLTNLNTVQEKENSPSQSYQNSMSIHEMEAQEGESSMVKEIEEVITLRSGKEVDLPTYKLDHKVESETEKEKREEIKGKKKGKSTEKDDYIDEEPQRIVIKKELMKKHMPPPFLQALYEKIIQSKSQMIKIRRNCKEIEGSLLERNRSENRAKTGVWEISQPLRNQHFAAKPFHSLRPLSAKIFAAAKPLLAHECHFAARLGSQKSRASNGAQFGVETKKLWSFEDKRAKLSENFAVETPFGRVFHSCETTFWHTSAIFSTNPLISKLRYSCEITFELRNHFLAHESHFKAPYTHFAAAEMSCEINFGLRNHF